MDQASLLLPNLAFMFDKKFNIAEDKEANDHS